MSVSYWRCLSRSVSLLSSCAERLRRRAPACRAMTRRVPVQPRWVNLQTCPNAASLKQMKNVTLMHHARASRVRGSERANCLHQSQYAGWGAPPCCGSARTPAPDLLASGGEIKSETVQHRMKNLHRRAPRRRRRQLATGSPRTRANGRGGFSPRLPSRKKSSTETKAKRKRKSQKATGHAKSKKKNGRLAGGTARPTD
jgi:hypothetical protein